MSRLSPHAFVLAVHDLQAEAAYYIDQLGFGVEWEDADNWRGLIRDDVRMMLGRCPETIPAANLGDHSYFAFLAIADVDAIHANLSSAAPKSWRRPPTNRGAGVRCRCGRPRASG